ncbi:MAG TPA: hypothetical protein VHF58_08840 [Solirubrobacterales bacterium]|nr:hypothetical protein [Solirubrobacterales bacterium]
MTDGRSGRAPLALRYADLVVLALALPAFVAFDWPLLGYAVCAAAWLAQHVVLAYADRRATEALAAGDRRRALGFVGGSTLGRLWLVTAPIIVVGLVAGDEEGLAAAILAAVLVTFHLGSLAISKAGSAEGRA